MVAVGVGVLSLPGELVSMTVVPGAIAVVIPAEGASAGVGVAHGGISLTVPRVIAVVIGPLLSLAVLRMPGRVIVRAHDGVDIVLEDGSERIFFILYLFSELDSLLSVVDERLDGTSIISGGARLSGYGSPDGLHFGAGELDRVLRFESLKELQILLPLSGAHQFIPAGSGLVDVDDTRLVKVISLDSVEPDEGGIVQPAMRTKLLFIHVGRSEGIGAREAVSAEPLLGGVTIRDVAGLTILSFISGVDVILALFPLQHVKRTCAFNLVYTRL